MCVHSRTNTAQTVLANTLPNLFGEISTNHECDYIDNEELPDLPFNKHDLGIIQLNIRGLKNKQAALSRLINNCLGTNKVDLILLCEIWLNDIDLKLINIPRYSFVVLPHKNRKGGGVGILINDQLQYSTRPDLTFQNANIESCFVEITNMPRKTIVGSIYQPPNTNEQEFINEIKSAMSKLNNERGKDSIIGLDHNLDLLKTQVHKPTERFYDQLLEQNFLPTITQPTRICKTSATLIDNILISVRLQDVYKSGIILNDISDHLPSICLLKDLKPGKSKTKTIYSRDLSKKNIEKINKRLQEELTVMTFNDRDVDKNFDKLHKTISNCLDDIAPERIIKLSVKQYLHEPWMHKSILKCSKKQQKLYKNWLSSRNDSDYIKYIDYRNTYKRLKRHCKISYYSNKCVEYKNNCKKLWSTINHAICKHNDKSNIVDCITVANLEITDSTQIANEFGHYFASIGKNYAEKIPASKNPPSSYLNRISRNEKSIYFVPCTRLEIKDIISKLPNKNSSGYDNISNKLLKELCDTILEPLYIIFNQSLELGIFPTNMKHGEVVPLYKNGSRKCLANYRPITLLLTISKVLEKLVYKRVYLFLNNNNQIYSSQYGFRSSHSCENAITELISTIVKNLEDHKYTVALFLDLSKAFDTLEHDLLLQKLDKYGIRGTCLNWFKSYLNGRKMRAKCNMNGHNTYSEEHVLKFGTPQGSCLGPLLFLVFCNDLRLHLELTSCILFADDTTLFHSHKDLKYLRWCILHDIDLLMDWFQANKLTLNLKKSSVMLFSPDGKDQDFNISISDIVIPTVKETKFLGVWIDHKLNWNTNFSKVINKVKQGLKLLGISKNLLTKEAKRLVYFAHIQSHINYGLIIWGNMISSSQLSRLQKLQNKCVMLINNWKHDTSNKLFQMLRILKIKDLLHLENCKSAFKFINGLLPSPIESTVKKDQTGNSLSKTH